MLSRCGVRIRSHSHAPLAGPTAATEHRIPGCCRREPAIPHCPSPGRDGSGNRSVPGWGCFVPAPASQTTSQRHADIDCPHRFHLAPCSGLLHIHGKQESWNWHIRVFGRFRAGKPLICKAFFVRVPFCIFGRNRRTGTSRNHKRHRLPADPKSQYGRNPGIWF